MGVLIQGRYGSVKSEGRQLWNLVKRGHRPKGIIEPIFQVWEMRWPLGVASEISSSLLSTQERSVVSALSMMSLYGASKLWSWSHKSKSIVFTWKPLRDQTYDRLGNNAEELENRWSHHSRTSHSSEDRSKYSLVIKQQPCECASKQMYYDAN